MWVERFSFFEDIFCFGMSSLFGYSFFAAFEIWADAVHGLFVAVGEQFGFKWAACGHFPAYIHVAYRVKRGTRGLRAHCTHGLLLLLLKNWVAALDLDCRRLTRRSRLHRQHGVKNSVTIGFMRLWSLTIRLGGHRIITFVLVTNDVVRGRVVFPFKVQRAIVQSFCSCRVIILAYWGPASHQRCLPLI